MENTPTEAAAPASSKSVLMPKIELPKLSFSNRTLILSFVVLVILGSAYGYRNFLIAATIDGSPVSRLTVIRELEAKGGKAALDAIITERLIAAEAAKAHIVVSAADIDAELEDVKAEIAAQGMTLEGALVSQGLTLDDVRKQLTTRKELEQLLGDTVTVTDADIDAYLVETKLATPKTMSEEDFRAKVKTQLANQKFGKEADRWIADIRKKSNIRYLAGYAQTADTMPAAQAGTPTP